MADTVYKSSHTGKQLDAAIDSIMSHVVATNNPHRVTKTQIGLGNVNNTSDADKPLSTAATSALALKQDTKTAINTSNIGSQTVYMASYAGSLARYTTEIEIEGDMDTYYPVTISLDGSLAFPQFISVWKKLGSKSASYSGSHPTSGNSMWLEYVGRTVIWDGNGGYIHTLYRSMRYANLCARTEIPECEGAPDGHPIGVLCLYLRGGGTTYEITTNYNSAVNVYYERTRIYDSDTDKYDTYVEPTTELGNLGILNTQNAQLTLDKSHVGLGNVDNTSDANKPVSTAVQTALDGKEDKYSCKYVPFAGILSSVSVQTSSIIYDFTPEDIYYAENIECFVVLQGAKYYKSWTTKTDAGVKMTEYNTDECDAKDNLYFNLSGDTLSVVYEGKMIQIGS